MDASRQIEALLLASPEPVLIDKLTRHFGADLSPAVAELAEFWRSRGMWIRVKDGAISLLPSDDVVKALAAGDAKKGRKLSEAAIETLCYIAIHQPVTARDIEEGRNVALFRGLLSSLLDAGFVRSSMRMTNAGRAAAYVTTDLFLDHFGLSSLADLPTREELLELAGDTPQIENDDPHPQFDVAFGLATSNRSPESDESQSSLDPST